jgi:hypothetical protein
VGFAGAIGLDYQALGITAQALGIRLDRVMLGRMQLLEYRQLDRWARQRKQNRAGAQDDS